MLLLLLGPPEDGLYVDVSGANGATWVGAGACVRSGDVNFEGYRPELDESRPGEMTLVVSNQGRAWDPDYAASSLAGANDVGCRVRLTMWQGGAPYQLFLGTIDRIEQTPDLGGHDMTATVVAVDDNALLSGGRLPSGYAVAAQSIAGGAVYLPLAEDQALIIADQLTLTGTGGAWNGAPPRRRDLAPSTPGGQEFALGETRLAVSKAFVSSGVGWHLSFSLAVGGAGELVGNRRLLQPLRPVTAATDSSGDFILLLSPPSGLGWGQAGSGGLAAQAFVDSTGLDLWNGAPHHFVFEGRVGVGVDVYVNGVLLPVSGFAFNLAAVRTLSAFSHAFGGDPVDYLTGVAAVTDTTVAIGHIFQAPGVGYAATLYNAWRTGSIAAGAGWDTPTQRVAWLLDQAAVPAGTLESSSTPLRGVSGGESPNSHARKVAASDQGRVWVDARGLGQYRSGSGGSVVMELRDDDDAKRYSGIRPTRDRSRRVTAARAVDASGALVARYDGGSSPSREVEVEVLNVLPGDAHTNLEQLVTSRDDVGTVYPEVTIVPADGDRWAQVLNLEFGQYVRLVRTPVAVGSVVNVAAPVEGIRHTFGSHSSTFRTMLSLGIPTPSNFFILGASQLGHERLA